MVERFNTVPGERDGVSLDNLTRLGLLQPIRGLPNSLGAISDTITAYGFTELGWEFVRACRTPRKTD
jgi:hypothetical protein